MPEHEFDQNGVCVKCIFCNDELCCGKLPDECSEWYKIQEGKNEQS